MSKPESPLPPHVQAAVRDGNLIQAIKLLRESSGLGLKEAKDLIDAHARGASAAPASAAPSGELAAPVVQALLAGRKIEAIRLLREQTGLGLKEAKEAVEASQIERQLAPGEVPGGASRLAWFVVVALLAFAGYYFLGSRG